MEEKKKALEERNNNKIPSYGSKINFSQVGNGNENDRQLRLNACTLELAIL